MCSGVPEGYTPAPRWRRHHGWHHTRRIALTDHAKAAQDAFHSPILSRHTIESKSTMDYPLNYRVGSWWGLSRIAEQCQHCDQVVLVGHSDRGLYRVDPIPLSPAGELRAVISGLRTYYVHGKGMLWRSPDHVRGDTRRDRPVVFADHWCGYVDADDVDSSHLECAAQLIYTAARREFTADVTRDDITHQQPADTAGIALLTQHLGNRVVSE